MADSVGKDLKMSFGKKVIRDFVFSFSELKNSLNLAKKHVVMLMIASILDIVFFFSQAFFTTPISDRISENAVMVSAKLSPLLAAQETGLLAKLFTAEFKPLTGKIMLLILLYLIILYVIYVIFQGVSWWLALGIAERKQKFRKYFLGFAWVNIAWFGFYVGFKMLDLLLGLRRVVIEKFSPGSMDIAGGFMTVLFLFFALAAVFSYPLLKRKQLFATPRRVSIPLVVWSVLLIALTRIFLNLIGRINVTAAIVIGIVVLFPVLIIVKVYIIKVVHDKGA